MASPYGKIIGRGAETVAKHSCREHTRMNTSVVVDGIAETSPRVKARIVGVFYLLNILTGVFA
jgi:hypothetical protein